ncbi:MAG: hypothetical protein WBG70_23240 [Spirulinaceae cyanobacterium]
MAQQWEKCQRFQALDSNVDDTQTPSQGIQNKSAEEEIKQQVQPKTTQDNQGEKQLQSQGQREQSLQCNSFESCTSMGDVAFENNSLAEAMNYYKAALDMSESDPASAYLLSQISVIYYYLMKIDATLSQAEQEDEQSWQQRLWGMLNAIGGGLLGEFNSDPSLAEIGIDTAIGVIPGFDQVADGRALIAHLYFMLFKGEVNKPLRWVGLAFSLIGLIPTIGSAVKGISKVLLKGTDEALAIVDDLLGLIRRVLPEGGIAEFRRFVQDNWGKWVEIGTNEWNDLLRRISDLVERIPGIGPIAAQKRQLQEALEQVRNNSSMLEEAFNKIRQQIDQVLEALGRRLGPDGELVPANGGRVPAEVDDIQGPMRIEGGRQGSEPNPNLPSSRFLNVDEAKAFVARKIASGESITLDLFGGRVSQLPGAINYDIVAEEGIRATIGDLSKIFPDNSVDEIVASGPQAAFLEEAARLLKPGGRISINANFSNRYRWGTGRGSRRKPNEETLDALGLRLIDNN